MKKPTPEQLAQRREQVRQLFPDHSYSEIAVKLGVGRTTITLDCRALNLKKTTAQRSLAIAKGHEKAYGKVFWSAEMVEILELMYPVMTAADVAELLGASEDGVSGKVYKLRLKKREKAPKATKAALPKPTPAPKPKPEPAPAPKPKPEPAPPAYRGPPPMTAAQIAQREKLRITYAPDKLPWRAQMMLRPATGLPDLSHRSS